MNIAKLNKRALLFRIVIYNLVLLFFLIFTGFFIFNYKLENQKKIILDDQKTKFISIKSVLTNYIKELKSDTLILSRIPAVQKFTANKDSQPTGNQLFETVNLIMDEKNYLKKLSIISLSGENLFSIENDKGVPTLAKNKNLNNNFKNKYFNAITNLIQGEVYICSLDFNVPDNKLNNIMKPVIQLTTPVYNKEVKVGYISTNSILSSLISSFSTILKNSDFKFYLINAKGKFLFFNSTDKLLDEVSSSPYKYMVFKRVLMDNDTFFSYNGSLFYKENINLNLGSNTASLVLAIEYPKKSFNLIKDELYSKLKNDIIGIFIIVAILLTLLICVLSRLNLNKLQFNIFGKLIEQSNDGIIITNPDGDMIYANSSFLKLFELSAKTAYTSNISIFNSEFHDNDFYSYMWKKINTSGNWEGEIINSSINNKKIFSNLKITSIDIKKTKQKFLIWTYKDLTETKYEKIETLKMQLYDTCTGLPNKPNIIKHLTKLIKSKTEFGLLSINISNLNEIINKYGYDTADIILVMLTEKLKKVLSDDTFHGRLEESKIIAALPSIDLSNLEKKLKNLLSLTKSPFNLFSEKIYLKFSLNVIFYPEAGNSLETLFKALEKTEYSTRNSEPEFFKYFSEKSKEMEIKKQKIFEHLKNAIEEKEFTLNYQPKVNIKNNKIVGAETLLRWNSSELGQVSPSVFIPIAEEFGLIDKITEWTVNNLCKQIYNWKQENKYSVPISINISPYEFKKDDFSETLINTIVKHELVNSNIEIEITEDVISSENEDIIEKINKLKESGFKILVDDFGTGNSSLGYLKNLNIDALKIDREFIKNYPESDDGGLAKIINDIAKTLKLEVIAEGVETEKQVSLLRNIGCSIAQGYYYSKPLDPLAFENLLQNKTITK